VFLCCSFFRGHREWFLGSQNEEEEEEEEEEERKKKMVNSTISELATRFFSLHDTF